MPKTQDTPLGACITMPPLQYPHITIQPTQEDDDKHSIHKLYDKNGRRIECMQRDTIQRIFGLWKTTNEDLLLIKDALGIKEYQNGDRDKQIQEAKQRIQEIGEKSEAVDENIKADVQQLKIDIAVIKTAVLKEEKQDNRKWSLKTKLTLAILTSIIAPLLILLIVYLVKTLYVILIL